MSDSNPAETFGYVARELGKRGIAFICAREALGFYFPSADGYTDYPELAA